MANRSTFPTSIDSFVEHFELSASDKPLLTRFQELRLKSSLTPTESDELSTLSTQLRNKLISAEDFNKLQDAIVNLQTFFRDETDGFIQGKQIEFQGYIDSKTTEINNHVSTKSGEITSNAANATNSIQTTKDSALIAIEQKKENVITYMDSTTAGAIRNDMGVMGELTTTDKASLVKAINEVNTKAPVDASTSQKGIVQLNDTLISASTTQAATANTIKVTNDKIGILSELETTDKSNLVGATNEINQKVNELAAHQADDVRHVNYGVATGSANTYAVTLSPAPTAYVEGMAVSVKLNVNASAASTLNVNGLGAKGIKKSNGTDVTNLKANGIYTFRYGGTNFILQGEGGEYGTAQGNDVRNTKTFGTENGVIQGSLDLSNLTPSNIKAGVNIDGVLGTLIEGFKIKSVQRGQLTYMSEPYISAKGMYGKDVSISSVDKTKSVVFCSVTNGLGEPINTCVTSTFLNNNTITLYRFINNQSITVHWTMIEFENAKSIQSGWYSDYTSNTKNVTVTTVESSKTMIFATRAYSLSGTTSADAHRFSYRQTSNTNLEFIHHQNGSVYNFVHWFLVESW
jgi:hypothetical protein